MAAFDGRKTRVAVLGAGTMGSAMARRLLATGFDVSVWNRSELKLRPLADAGAAIGDTPADAVAGANYVITMLADGGAVQQVVSGPQGASQGMARGALWLQMSSVGLAATERFGRLASYLSIDFLDAPVLGSGQLTERGDLVILVSGRETSAERSRPVLEALGRKVIWLGALGRATRLNLVMNTWMTTTVAALAETLSLALSLEVEPEDFFTLLADSPLNMPNAHIKGRAMVAESFEPSQALRLAQKDLRVALEAARDSDLRLPSTEAAFRQYQKAAELGHDDDDLAAVLYAVKEPSVLRKTHGRP